MHPFPTPQLSPPPTHQPQTRQHLASPLARKTRSAVHVTRHRDRPAATAIRSLSHAPPPLGRQAGSLPRRGCRLATVNMCDFTCCPAMRTAPHTYAVA
eukprot:7378383-Prymnesium_polylepis.1